MARMPELLASGQCVFPGMDPLNACWSLLETHADEGLAATNSEQPRFLIGAGAFDELPESPLIATDGNG